MSEITKSQVYLNQGTDHKDRTFGYVSGSDGGFFFTWMGSMDGTLASIEEDDQDGSGGLRKRDVREFLAEYLPTTARGKKMMAAIDVG